MYWFRDDVLKAETNTEVRQVIDREQECDQFALTNPSIIEADKAGKR